MSQVNNANNAAPIYILLIEDEIDLAKPLKEQLERNLKALGKIIVDIAQSLDEADQKIRQEPYCAIQIDLRLPKNKGGVIDGSPAGLQSGEVANRVLPLALNVIWSNYAHKHPKAAQFAGQYDCPYWSKGSPPTEFEPELPHYTAALGARAFTRMLTLWPQQDSQELQNGEVSWAERFFKRGRALLPEQMAICCGHLSNSLNVNTDAKAQAIFPAIFEFSEWVRRWLWVVAAATIRNGGLLEKVSPYPNGINGRYLINLTMQERLQTMLTTWAGSRLANQNRLLLRFLNIVDAVPDTINIIDALHELRIHRNDWAHQGVLVGGQTALESFNAPMRLVMQAAHFLAAWPMVTEIEPVGNHWRLTCVRGQFPWPKEEWELNLPSNFRPQPNHVYQIWPHEDGSMGLVDLWPWLECRPDEDLRRNRLWQALGPSDGRNIFEASFNEPKEYKFTKDKPLSPFRPMPRQRWEELEKIATKLHL